jgi:hypothetical protein
LTDGDPDPFDVTSLGGTGGAEIHPSLEEDQTSGTSTGVEVSHADNDEPSRLRGLDQAALLHSVQDVYLDPSITVA